AAAAGRHSANRNVAERLAVARRHGEPVTPLAAYRQAPGPFWRVAPHMGRRVAAARLDAVERISERAECLASAALVAIECQPVTRAQPGEDSRERRRDGEKHEPRAIRPGPAQLVEI